jgi:glycerol-3-phosphate cytidylyltransferase-like family protein
MDAARMVSVHASAAKNLINARKDVLDLSEREKRLVSGDWVKKVMQDHDGSVAQLLKSMPKQLAGRIAPHDPEHAERELERWVQEVCLKTLHSTDPWK